MYSRSCFLLKATSTRARTFLSINRKKCRLWSQKSTSSTSRFFTFWVQWPPAGCSFIWLFFELLGDVFEPFWLDRGQARPWQLRSSLILWAFDFVTVLRMGPVRTRHSSHDFGWQSSHSVDLTGWPPKMASIEIWIPWCNAHKSHLTCQQH